MRSQSRILVVEDDPLTGDLFAALLPEHGMLVDVVDSAEEAVSALDRSAGSPPQYDLVLTDQHLEGLSGLDLLQHVKSTEPELDVVIMTAFADMASVLKAVEAGVYDYLVKPFDSPDEVLRVIRRALEKREVVRENQRLIKYLTQANAQIEAMNRDLEAKVNERTQQLEEANRRLEQLSLTDDVTGLYNQRYLFTRLDEEFHRAFRHHYGLAVMMIDLDHFKEVNDRQDHLFGSRVLKRAGDLFRRLCRNVDLVIRYGGDEFVIILPHTSLAQAVTVGERLRSVVARTDLGDEARPCRVTISVGVASIDDSDVGDPRDLLQAADRAMYLAKHGGRNRLAVMDGTAPVAVVAGIG